MLTERPSCDANCGDELRDFLRGQNVEATVTHLPPLIRPAFEAFDHRCPHGVTWHVEFTGDQWAAWKRDGVC